MLDGVYFMQRLMQNFKFLAETQLAEVYKIIILLQPVIKILSDIYTEMENPPYECR